MDRYYGVITSTKESALKFMMDLSAATATDKGGPIKAVTSYSLTSMTIGLYNQLINHLLSAGYITVMPTDDAINVVLESLTKDQISPYDAELNPELDVVAALGENIYLVVHPADSSATEQGDFNWRSRIRVVQKVITTEEIEPEESSEEEEEDPVEPETVTTVRTNSVDLIAINSNNAAKYIAYEITSTYSGDALIKIATTDGNGFPAEEDSLQRFLQVRFTQMNIKAYKAWAESDTAYIAHVDGDARHKAFNSVSGVYGGFVIHQMKKESSATTIYDEGSDSVTAYGLTIFWTDGTPLYTWSDSSEPWDTVTEAGWGGVNRQIGRTVHGNRVDPEDSDSDPIIKMGALGPIFCPSMNDVAKYAKWMVQGPHDYSYFDNSGHLYLKGLGETSALGNSNDNVFFMDYGIALWDGPLSNFTLSNKSIPDIYPDNEGLYIRPYIENLIPYGGVHMQAYFDGKKGLNPTVWQSINDEGCDMSLTGVTVSAPILSLPDKTYGLFNGSYISNAEANTHTETIFYMVFSLDFNLNDVPSVTYDRTGGPGRPLISFTDNTNTGNDQYTLFLWRPQNYGLRLSQNHPGASDLTFINLIATLNSGTEYILAGHRVQGTANDYIKWYIYDSVNAEIASTNNERANNGPTRNSAGSYYVGALNADSSACWVTNRSAYRAIGISNVDYPVGINIKFLSSGWGEGSNLLWASDTRIINNMEYLIHRFALAEEYSSTKSYSAGSYCMREGALYKALTAVNNEDWNSEHWELRVNPDEDE